MNYQKVFLTEKTLLELLAAIKVCKIEIDEEDYKSLKDAYQYTQDEKVLIKNQLNNVKPLGGNVLKMVD